MRRVGGDFRRLYFAGRFFGLFLASFFSVLVISLMLFLASRLSFAAYVHAASYMVSLVTPFFFLWSGRVGYVKAESSKAAFFSGLRSSYGNLAYAAFFTSILFLGFLVYFMLPQGVWANVQARGFGRLEPQSVGGRLVYKGVFSGIFVNKYNSTVILYDEGLVVTDNAGASCGRVSASAKSVQPRESFELKAFGCRRGVSGEVYSLNFTIPYSVVVQGALSNRTIYGTLRGVLE